MNFLLILLFFLPFSVDLYEYNHFHNSYSFWPYPSLRRYHPSSRSIRRKFVPFNVTWLSVRKPEAQSFHSANWPIRSKERRARADSKKVHLKQNFIIQESFINSIRTKVVSNKCNVRYVTFGNSASQRTSISLQLFSRVDNCNLFPIIETIETLQDIHLKFLKYINEFFTFSKSFSHQRFLSIRWKLDDKFIDEELFLTDDREGNTFLIIGCFKKDSKFCFLLNDNQFYPKHKSIVTESYDQLRYGDVTERYQNGNIIKEDYQYYIYQIDGKDIIEASCQEKLSINSFGEMAYGPKMGSMFGGNIIEASGLCTNFTNSQITCNFIVPHSKLDKNRHYVYGERLNKYKIRCSTPPIFTIGHVHLFVEDSKIDHQLRLRYYVNQPNDVNSKLHLVDMENWLSLNPSRLTMKWNTDGLMIHKSHLVLFGYRSSIEVGNKKLTLLTTIVNDVSLQEGYISITPHQVLRKLRQSGKNYRKLIEEFNIGIFALEMQVPSTEAYRGPPVKKTIWSKPFTLDWLREQLEEEIKGFQTVFYPSTCPSFASWPEKQCDNWIRREKNEDRMSQIKEIVPKCPCTIYQAEIDNTNFITDEECNKYNNDKLDNCQYHQSAIHCIRSIKLNDYGAGSQCCYGINGNLLNDSNLRETSTLDASSIFGNWPYNERGSIPQLSHWENDIVPYFHCCRHACKKTTCSSFLRQHDFGSCTDYDMPFTISFSGNPLTYKLFNKNNEIDTQSRNSPWSFSEEINLINHKENRIRLFFVNGKINKIRVTSNSAIIELSLTNGLELFDLDLHINRVGWNKLFNETENYFSEDGDIIMKKYEDINKIQRISINLRKLQIGLQIFYEKSNIGILFSSASLKHFHLTPFEKWYNIEDVITDSSDLSINRIDQHLTDMLTSAYSKGKITDCILPEISGGWVEKISNSEIKVSCFKGYRLESEMFKHWKCIDNTWKPIAISTIDIIPKCLLDRKPVNRLKTEFFGRKMYNDEIRHKLGSQRSLGMKTESSLTLTILFFVITILQ
ncbi:hypothetical protein SNEBB_007192 [Seison nebaliae]|nr:hypothetical protein SNEBB_007192 [Seison nebaliae]